MNHYGNSNENTYNIHNESIFNINQLKLINTEKDEMHIKYENKYINIYSNDKLFSYGIKLVNNVTKVSCSFNNNDNYKKIYIKINDRIQNVLKKNENLKIYNPISSKSNSIDFIIDKYSKLSLITCKGERIYVPYNEVNNFMNHQLYILPITYINSIKINEKEELYINFKVKELNFQINYGYNINLIENIFVNSEIKLKNHNDNNNDNNSKKNRMQYIIDN